MINLRPSKLVRLIFLLGLTFCLVTLIAVDQWSRYRFGVSLHQMAGRHLPKEIAWQKEQRPSLKPLLIILDKLIPADDRYIFSATNKALPALWSNDWSTDLVGPSTDYYSSSVRYDARGRPTPSLQNALLQNDHLILKREIIVNSSQTFKQALNNAKSGDVITLTPGNYVLKGHSIDLKAAGESSAPIRVRARKLGEVRLQFDLLEGFHVVAPHWIFENLEIEGVCTKHGRCEHAFHIVGKGKNVTLRNLFIKNFNSHVKVNGSKSKDYPDGGLIEYSMFINDKPRETDNPVTLIDIVAANDWIVRKSVIADFAKAKGNKISYAGFFKGAGQNNLFEQNLVLCEFRHKGGVRVGLSFGGGGTSANVSRGNTNAVEHFGGILRRNVIANCPLDVGIYLNKSKNTVIAGNLLINNIGMHIRFKESDAMILGNNLSGSIVNRDGGKHEPFSNSSNSLGRLVYPHFFQDKSVLTTLKGDLVSERATNRHDTFGIPK